MLNIKQRQMNLKFLNYYKKEVDGKEGTGTKEAYKAFQKDYNLSVDGIYGKNTDNKLIAVIKEIQNKIGVTADGIAGNNTIAKLEEYQKKNRLSADGICGKNTIAKLNTKTNLTWDNIKHFKKSEFNCPCCNKNNIELEVVKIADQIREYFGKPCIVNSGSRCTKHNKKVGGVTNSRHLIGKAIDLKVSGIDGGTLVNYTKQLVKQGKLRYTYRITANGTAVHIDIQ